MFPMLKLLRAQLFHPILFWKINLLVWITFNTITFFIRYEAFHSFKIAFLSALYLIPIEFILSSLLREGYHRWLSEGLLRFKTNFLILVFSFSAATIEALITIYYFQLYTQWNEAHHWLSSEAWLIRTLIMGVIYVEWSLGYFGIKAELHAHQEHLLRIEAQSEAQRLELQLLRNQLDPHFLFNSLNGIATEIMTHPQIAFNMLHELADYLRYSLEHRHCLLTPLSVEMHAVAAYLRIEKLRFGDRLKINIHSDPLAQNKRLPSFLLQPLIENAVKHGFSSSPPPWSLVISATLNDKTLCIRLCNTGSIIDQKHFDGIGYNTIKRRLELHYPKRHRFTLEEQEGLVCVNIELEGEPCLE